MTYGTDARKNINGVMTLWAGDANGDGSINATDRTITWNQRNSAGYLTGDVSVDGNINATDRTTAWNNRNKNAQLP